MSTQTIGIVGSGNVGIHLARAFSSLPKNEVSLVARSDKNHQYLDRLDHLRILESIEELSEDLSFLILAVNDRGIKTLAQKLSFKNTLLLHTSGSVSIDDLSENRAANYGVIYPLQSFSLKRTLNYSEIPFLTEADTEENHNKIKNLVSDLGAKNVKVNSINRKKIHLSAVIVNNFVNHLYARGAEYLSSDKLPFELLLPLIRETTARLDDLEPSKLQTGPAVRYDVSVINEHLEMLSEEPELQELYRVISNSIVNLHKKV